MRTTVNLDEELVKEAMEYSGISNRSELIKAGLTALVERGAARKLARIGGTQPQLKDIPRRRPASE